MRLNDFLRELAKYVIAFDENSKIIIKEKIQAVLELSEMQSTEYSNYITNNLRNFKLEEEHPKFSTLNSLLNEFKNKIFFLLCDTQIEKDMNEEFVSKNTSFTNLKFITSKEIKEGKNVENLIITSTFKKVFTNYKVSGAIKNIYLINSKHIDFSQRLKNHLPQDKIVFIDGNYKNDEFFFRENLDIKKIEQNYFIYLSKVLKKLESIFQKKIEIALHPSSDEKVYKEFFNKLDIQVSKGNTRKKIYQAYLVLFHESSAIMDAIFLKKKIVSLSTDLFGKYHSDRVRFYKEKLKLLSIDIKEGVKLSKKDILQKLEAGIVTYNQYLENINSEKNYLKSSEKVIKVLKSHIN